MRRGGFGKRGRGKHASRLGRNAHKLEAQETEREKRNGAKNYTVIKFAQLVLYLLSLHHDSRLQSSEDRSTQRGG